MLSTRRASLIRRCHSPVWSSPSSTAPAKAAWWSRFRRSLGCRSSLSGWANRPKICNRSIPTNLPRRCSSRPEPRRRTCVSTHSDLQFMTEALRLARRAYGLTSPNPMVGAVLVKAGRIIGRGWHHRAGQPHGEIEALNDAEERGNDVAGATLYVTLEPCSTFGRTPPCTAAILEARLRRLVIGATDPNPKHCGKGITLLKRA